MHLGRQDKLTFLVTFLIGVITGSYLYLVGFAPQFEASQGVKTADEVSEFMLVGEMYGGMRAGMPPSFQVEGSGDYRYLAFSSNPEVPGDAFTGSLPRDLWRDLKAKLTPAELQALAEPVDKEVCAQMYDGVDYRYKIVEAGTTYQLDSCLTAFSVESALGEQFAALWDYLATTHDASVR